MKTNKVDIVGVECLEVRGDNPDVGVIFFHGYGANMHDLFPLWQMWHRESFNWYFPNGINPLPMGYDEGRSWFSIDVIELERAMREGRHRDLSHHLPPELDTTLHMLENLVIELSKRHKKIILGGFSQGAMCASHLAMRESLHIDGLILLSGVLLAQERFPRAVRSVPFYQSHGTRDPILSIEGAKDLEKKLHSLNFSGHLHTFTGGHEIPAQVIEDVRRFLEQFVA
jgi:phospholipase/carboxylesterase